MENNQAPRSRDELIKDLSHVPFVESKAGREALDQFIATISYRHGGIAHMEYKSIESSLDGSEFEQFLAFLGIPDEMFAKYKNAYCASHGAAGPSCAPGGDYCNPSLCNLPWV